ncbi:MAG: type IV pilus biogenesis/stability protein PilW [Agitococcus sp.]|nr:type IV pilus biogenesis/stability protein PilW [Agitococcus sp.]
MKNLCLIMLSLCSLQACTVQEFANDRKADPAASARARVAIAAEYIQTNKPELALQSLERALELDPKSAEAHNVMGVLLEKDDDFVKAEQNYRKALSLKPEYPQARNNYGVLLYRLKRYKEAMEQFSIAAADLSYERRETALEYVGKIALMLGDKEKAKVTFERALKLNSRLPEPALELATFAYDEQNYPEANRFYQRYLRAIDKDVQSARGLWLGIRLARINHDNNALASYELALKRLYANSEEYQTYLNSPNSGS